MTSSERILEMGLQMRKARQLKRDRQKDLAARMGVSRLTIIKMEKGGVEASRISLATWLNAAEHLGLIDTWNNVMSVRSDPFDEYDRKVREEKRITRGRVKKSR